MMPQKGAKGSLAVVLTPERYSVKRFVWCLVLALGPSTAARADDLPEWSIWKNPRESC